MADFLGGDIEIGDTVVFLMTGSPRKLCTGEVFSISDKKAVIKHKPEKRNHIIGESTETQQFLHLLIGIEHPSASDNSELLLSPTALTKKEEDFIFRLMGKTNWHLLKAFGFDDTNMDEVNSIFMKLSRTRVYQIYQSAVRKILGLENITYNQYFIDLD